MLTLHSPEVKFAIEAIRQASHLVAQVRAEMVSPALTKEDRSPVTVADFSSQALVAHLLEEAFPDDALVGEEDATALRIPSQRPILEHVTQFVSVFAPIATPESVCAWIDRGAAEHARRFWTLDPIDGTKGFLRGDQYAVALALIEDGQVQIGVLGCPNLVGGYLPAAGDSGSLVVAERMKGAWVVSLNGRGGSFTQLQVSDYQDPVRARLLRSFESGHTNAGQIDLFAQTLGAAAQPVRMDSQAKYALLAAGQAELYLRLLSPQKPDYKEKIWDQAAGSLIVEEAGGWVTDLDGKPLDFTAGRSLSLNRGILASNGHLHAIALESLRAIGA
ncbi:MAG TPA: 3'(2'),5'-bisphosphate nucleotidase [Anaerolineales bacterium]|nr:3'(2'),5'-bisphosphate nucleotidase [Anaerolineales bacterium]